MAACNRTDAHSLSECPNYTPAEPVYPVVGAYVEIETTYTNICGCCGPVKTRHYRCSWCKRWCFKRPTSKHHGETHVHQPAVSGQREPEVATVLVTSLEQCADERGREFTYMGWRNVQPGGRWDRRLGSWGFTRLYAPAVRPAWGTRVLRLVPA